MVLQVSAGRMVGRDHELGRLLTLLDDAEAGRSVAALVSGDAGVGKSRLVREVAQLAAGRGFTVLSGQCAELFRSGAKFESHCGWPSFYQPSESDAVVLIEDRSLGTIRTEVRCAACDSHLGHVFAGEGYEVPTDQRWCINSVSLQLEPSAG